MHSRRTLRWASTAACLLLACGGADGGGGGTAPWTATAASDAEGTGGSEDGASSSGNSSGSAEGSSGAAEVGSDASSHGGSSEAGSESGDTGDPSPGLEPPAGGSSGGTGGGAAAGESRMTAEGGITYRIIAPGGGGPLPLMIVYSGTEGGGTMTNNLLQVADFTGTGGFVFAVLDGVQYNGDGHAGELVLDEVRAQYDIDNDRTYLLSESAGTTAGLELGLTLRQSYFAAYWANDVNAQRQPSLAADALGFAPFGNAGPGGDFADAEAIVAGMDAAGYRTPEPSPYDGPGSGTHGDPNQFVAALQWFPGKSRQ
jgi:hypothetical protein